MHWHPLPTSSTGLRPKLGWFARLPWAFIRLAAWFVPTWAALLEMRYLWETRHALANAKLVSLIGRKPHTEFATAATHAVRDLGLTPTSPAHVGSLKLN